MTRGTMRLSSKFSVKLVLVISFILGFFNSPVFVSGFPQWVWNPDANSGPPGGGKPSGNNVIFGSVASESTKDVKEVPIEIVDTQARLFPQIVSAISNSINGGNSGSGGSNTGSGSYPIPGGGGSSSCPSNSGSCIGGSVAESGIQNGINAGTVIAQNPGVQGIFGSILQNIFGGSASTLPAGIGNSDNKDPDSGSSSGGGGGSSGGVGSCTCTATSSCYLPNKPNGSCGSGMVNCCSTSRGGTRITIFPDEERPSSGNKRQVTRSQLRRALLRNIVRQSGSVVDDTIDLILHPFLTEADQKKVATRIFDP